MQEYLFSYGTLQKSSVQLELFGRTIIGTKDILKGYKTSPVEINDTSFLSKGENRNQLTLVFTNDESDTIAGMAFEVSMEELQEADKYEPAEYKRIRVKLGSGKQAWVYMAVGRNR